MDRKSFIRRRRLHHLLTLFAAFLIIFLTFDVIVYAIAENALYEDIDRQFYDASQAIEADADGSVENFMNGSNIVYNGSGSYIITYINLPAPPKRRRRDSNAAYLSAFDYMLNIGFSPSDSGKTRTEAAAEQRDPLLPYLYHACPNRVRAVYYIQMATDSTDTSPPWASSLRCCCAAPPLR
jgi:hypothetical protein